MQPNSAIRSYHDMQNDKGKKEKYSKNKTI